ncbi:hypothetical protein TKV_c10600 [Thermoanaerobacter kivui]|uniref:Uncharacterized protein n=1 Tax=Thermoanaerobacter kivui TaxID=2325 RepID=A0A097AQY4_THEKI|nr:hypothetical protein TKV_c10600 [Thermoanaerobacter kivui]
MEEPKKTKNGETGYSRMKVVYIKGGRLFNRMKINTMTGKFYCTFQVRRVQ